ncbi:hypothetical protein Tco_0845180 [Tanacetum coccineum]
MVFRIPTSVISLDMAKHPCPWEVKMSDPGRERGFFLHTSKAGRDHPRRTMCPHDDAFLPVPRFPLLGNSGGDYHSMSSISFVESSKDNWRLVKGLGCALRHAFFSALSGQLAFWIQSNGTLHGFLDFSQIHCRKLAKLAEDPESGVQLRGKKVVLSSSFTGSPRYMMQNYLDAMTICKSYGYPDLFITFTCNPNWPEISRFVAERNLKSEDRPDVITRVFKMKLDNLMKDLKDRHIFGHVKGAVYTIEFQKRGLPHCHILLWLEPEDKITTTAQIDQYISAEIPNKNEDPELYQIVTDHMMHGPCGADNPSCPCTIDFKCTKKFPKQFNETTVIDDNGYAIYKRRNDGNTITKSGTDLHNGYVAPYNTGLLRRYQSHINVEWCNQIGSIKYLFKYINKGPDRVTVAIDGEEVDEIKDFYDCRYLSSCDVAWRIYGFDIHYRTPPVERLPFLQDEQSSIFDATESIDYTLEKSSVNETKFIQWMELNKTDDFPSTLLYAEIPKYYVWNTQKRIWDQRQRGFSLGCIHHVPLCQGELFYLHVLLNKTTKSTLTVYWKQANGE